MKTYLKILLAAVFLTAVSFSICPNAQAFNVQIKNNGTNNISINMPVYTEANATQPSGYSISQNLGPNETLSKNRPGMYNDYVAITPHCSARSCDQVNLCNTGQKAASPSSCSKRNMDIDWTITFDCVSCTYTRE